MKRFFASVAVGSLLVFSSPAHAVIPVVDSQSISLQAAAWAKQASEMIQQISTMTKMLDLQYVASLTLGPDAGSGWRDLINASQDLYSSSLNAYNGAMTLPGKIQGEIDTFMPPDGGWENASTPVLLAKARAMQAMLSNTSAQTMGLQSKLIAQSSKVAQQTALNREQTLAARGQMQAIQAAGVTLVGIQQQLGDMQKTTTAISDLAAAKAAAEAENFGALLAADANRDKALKAIIDAKPGRPQLDPLPIKMP